MKAIARICSLGSTKKTTTNGTHKSIKRTSNASFCFRAADSQMLFCFLCQQKFSGFIWRHFRCRRQHKGNKHSYLSIFYIYAPSRVSTGYFFLFAFLLSIFMTFSMSAVIRMKKETKNSQKEWIPTKRKIKSTRKTKTQRRSLVSFPFSYSIRFFLGLCHLCFFSVSYLHTDRASFTAFVLCTLLSSLFRVLARLRFHPNLYARSEKEVINCIWATVCAYSFLSLLLLLWVFVVDVDAAMLLLMMMRSVLSFGSTEHKQRDENNKNG